MSGNTALRIPPSVAADDAPPAVTPTRARTPAVPATLAALVLVSAVFGSALCVARYRAMLYQDIDLAIFTQALANLLHGSLASSIRGASWLGDHSSLSLFLVAPFYALFRSPATLLVVQSTALALGALPVHRLARHETGDDRVALVAAALYLAHPALGYLGLFEFHPEALATPALLAAFAMLREGRGRATALWAAIALLGKEDAALVVGGLGVYALVRRGAGGARLGLELLGLAALSLALSFGALKPLLAHGAPDYGAMYAQWGRTPAEIATHLLRAPWRAAAALFATPGSAHDTLLKQEYWLQLLFPLAFLSLAAPGVLAIALPIAAEHLLSWRPQQHGILYQYTAFVIPFTIAAAVVGIGGLARRRGAPDGLALRLALLALATTLATQAMFGPLFGAGVLQADRSIERTWPGSADFARADETRRWIARIPPGGVVAGFEMLAPLADRTELHSLHHVVSGRYTFSSRRFPIPDGVVALIADFASAPLAIYPDLGTGARLRELIARNRLRPVARSGDRMLWLRDGSPAIDWLGAGGCENAPARPPVFDGQLAWLGVSLPTTAVAPGGTLDFATCWSRTATADRLFLTEWLVLDAAGAVRVDRMRPLGRLVLPPSDWPPGVAMRERASLEIPTDLPPGRYRLAMRVGSLRGGHAALAIPDAGSIPSNAGVVELGGFTVARPAPR